MAWIPFKVTKVTIKSYQGYYWTPKIAKNGPKQHNKLFFARRAKKASAEGRSPPQELEVSPRSGLYLLVVLKVTYFFWNQQKQIVLHFNINL